LFQVAGAKDFCLGGVFVRFSLRRILISSIWLNAERFVNEF
jgi:hypothetical protein